MIQESQPELYEEFRKLNLNVAIVEDEKMLEVRPTLEDQVREAQANDEEIKIIRECIKSSEAPDYTEDNNGVVFFKGRLLVPNRKEIKEMIMKEAHESA